MEELIKAAGSGQTVRFQGKVHDKQAGGKKDGCFEVKGGASSTPA